MNAHPSALRARIVADYEAGATYQQLAERYGISFSAVRKYVSLFRATGSVEPRPHGGGNQPALNEQQRELLRELCETFPLARLCDLADRLFEATGIRLSAGRVGRYLKALGYARRSVRGPAKKSLSKAGQEHVTPRRYRRHEAPTQPSHRRGYPSDLTDVEWAILGPLVPMAKPGGRKEEHPKREIVNAMLYLLRSGCQWRMLPHDLPPWQTAYNYYLEWRNNGLWERINQIFRERVRMKAGRQATPSAAIVDSQSAKTTEKGGSADMTGESV